MKRSTKYTLSALYATLSCLVPESFFSLRYTYLEWSRFTAHLVYHHGKPFMVKTLKEVHQSGKRRLLLCKPDKGYIPYSFWMKTDAWGLPRRLPMLRKLFNSRHRVLNLVAISITSSYLLYTLAPDYDLRQVVEKPTTHVPCVDQAYLDYLDGSRKKFSSKIKHNTIEMDPEHLRDKFIDFCRWFVPRFVGKPFEGQKFTRASQRIFSGFKGGPYGVPSFRYALIDAYNLASDFRDYLQSIFKIVEKVVPETLSAFRKDLYEADMEYRAIHGIRQRGVKSDTMKQAMMKSMMAAFAAKTQQSRKVDVPPKRKGFLAKFSFLSERGGKTRVITAVNYWIQRALFPLHHIFMNVLRRIKEDYAFNQDDAANFIMSMTSHKKRSAKSRDMTGATNRFPLWVQQLVLNLIKQGLGDDWAHVMSLPIHFKEGISHSFAAGQPMGIYSSWPVFSLCHHIVVRFCAWYCGFNPFTFRRYCIIGDDVVIFDRKVDRVYVFFLEKVLGVEISSFKSFSTTKTSPRYAEFAKRLYRDGREYSPISPYLLLTARSADVTLIRDIVERLVMRWGINPSASNPGSFVKALFKRILFVGQRNAAMIWFLQTNVVPVGHKMAIGLEQLREDIWKVEMEPYTGLIALSQYEKRRRMVKRLQTKLLSIEDRLIKLYGDKSSIVVPSKAKKGFRLSMSNTYPVVKTVRALLSSVKALGEYPLQSEISHLFILSRWILHFVQGRVTEKGSFYFQKRDLRAKLSKSMALSIQRRYRPALRNVSESSVATYSRPFYVPCDVVKRRVKVRAYRKIQRR